MRVKKNKTAKVLSIQAIGRGGRVLADECR